MEVGKSDEEMLADNLLNGNCSAVMVKYIGYMSLKKSISEVGKHEQQQICNTCIKIVAHYAGCIKDNILKKDFTDIIDTRIPQVWNQTASLAVSLDAIIISKQKKRNQKMLKKPLAKIGIQDVALTGIGTGTLSEFFCIVAKVRTETNALSERRCFVLGVVTAPPLGITSAITLAFLLKYRKEEGSKPKKQCRGNEFTSKDKEDEDRYSSVSFNQSERIRPSSILNNNANFNNYNDLPTPDESSSVSFICKPFELYMLKESKPGYKKLTRTDSVSTQNSPRTEATMIEDDLSLVVDTRSGGDVRSPTQDILPRYQVDWKSYEEASTRAEKSGPLAVREVQKLLLISAGDLPPIPPREDGVYYVPDDNALPPIVIVGPSLDILIETQDNPPPQLSVPEPPSRVLPTPNEPLSRAPTQPPNPPSPTPYQPPCNHRYEHLQNCLSGRRFLEKLKEEAALIQEAKIKSPLMNDRKPTIQHNSRLPFDHHKEVLESPQGPRPTEIHVDVEKFVEPEVFKKDVPVDEDDEPIYDEVAFEPKGHDQENEGGDEVPEPIAKDVDLEVKEEDGVNDANLFVLLANQKHGSYVHRRSNSPPGRVHITKPRFDQISEYLEDMLWFHGVIRREMAESLIIREGEFLVRQSSSFPGQIILTLMDSDDQPQHVCLVDFDTGIRTSEHEFNSAVQLIKYHLTNNLPLVYGNIVLYIRKPVYRPGSTPSSETPTPLGTIKRAY